MRLHANAKTCPAMRALLCRRVIEEGRTVTEAAEAAGVSARSAYQWLARYRAEGQAGLQDRSSRPQRSPTRTAPARVAEILRLRQERLTGEEIAERLGMAASSVSAVLRRAGLGRLRALEPVAPARRYEMNEVAKVPTWLAWAGVPAAIRSYRLFTAPLPAAACLRLHTHRRSQGAATSKERFDEHHLDPPAGLRSAPSLERRQAFARD